MFAPLYGILNHINISYILAFKYIILFSEEHMIANVHCLLHLLECVEILAFYGEFCVFHLRMQI